MVYKTAVLSSYLPHYLNFLSLYRHIVGKGCQIFSKNRSINNDPVDEIELVLFIARFVDGANDWLQSG